MKALLIRHGFSTAAALATMVLIAITAILLLRVLSLPKVGTTSAPVLAATIALPGVVATAAVTLIGYLLKQSVDLRTTRLAEESAAAARVEQKRLRVETAMGIVRLLATSAGTPAPVVQISAALRVLSQLGDTDLALELAAELWPKKQLTANSAVELCESAISSAEPELQRAAAILIFNNWRQLTSDAGQAQWPSSLLLGWPDHFDLEARHILTKALVEWVAARPGDDFRSRLIETSGIPPAPTASIEASTA